MASKDIIEQRIKENIGDIHLIRAEDVSGGCGSMFNLLIVSDKFKGLSRISQHRLVHQALGEIKDQLHALSLKLYSTEQYSKLHPIADVEASEEETKAQVDANANAAAAQPKEDEEKEDKNDISG
ncbi:BolA-like protein [Coemansia asiatica]|uniref:BolA-like protein n=1 Tax=Coemansia asiatica TaxID=1052880 RepID=A0A9W7XRF5_9FUNG|nr:BolA-like protein [Coemansia asiatica]KAJ2861626.1 BolA-like protein [Coemansia asiatica]